MASSDPLDGRSVEPLTRPGLARARACCFLVAVRRLRAHGAARTAAAGTTTPRTTPPGTSCMTGDPWLDGAHRAGPRGRPRGDDVGARAPQRHTVVRRFPGVIAICCPAYWIAQADSMTVVPGAITAALACASDHDDVPGAAHAVRDRGRAAGAARSSPSPRPCGPWPPTPCGHTPSRCSASAAWPGPPPTQRWWLVGVFGGVTLWGRLHAAVIVAVVGLLLGGGAARRGSRLVDRSGARFMLALVCRVDPLVERLLEPDRVLRRRTSSASSRGLGACAPAAGAAGLARSWDPGLDARVAPADPGPGPRLARCAGLGAGAAVRAAWPTRRPGLDRRNRVGRRQLLRLPPRASSSSVARPRRSR